MEWGAAHNFIWLWVLPAAVAIYFLAGLRRRGEIKRFGDSALVEKLITSLDARKRGIKRVFFIAALGSIVLALCQPHFKTKEIEVERRGVDVVIAVDVSRSMLARDIAPTRLDKAKLELETLIGRLKQDRIGIVAFAGDAFIQCPLTLDKSAVKLFLASLSPNIIPLPGTLIGRALAVALKAFDDEAKDHKAIILLTDGEDQGSNPLDFAKIAKDKGIPVYAIGIGTPDGGTLPSEIGTGEAKRDLRGNVVISKLDEPLLKRIAEITGGKYYRASRGELEIERIVREIRQMGDKGLMKDKITEYEENYQFFLWAALAFLFAEWILSERKKA